MHLMKTLTCIMLLAVSVVAGAREKPFAPEQVAGARVVSADEVVEMVLSSPGMVIIDSRKRAEYIKGHIEGAVSMLNTEMTPESLQAVAPVRDAKLLFYCNGVRCMRSADAIKKALAWGYTDIYWFRDGWRVWAEKRFPVVIE
jgi:rhodanese-related sulfurtransferase